jgi:hypothetical protein
VSDGQAAVRRSPTCSATGCRDGEFAGVMSAPPGYATTTPQDLDMTDAYLALAREHGIEMER